jgi:hypothetical protein
MSHPNPEYSSFLSLEIAELPVDECFGFPTRARETRVFVWLHEIEDPEDEFWRERSQS